MREGPNGHILLESKDCDRRAHTDYDTSCPVCHHGLGVCAKCGAAEIELEEPCLGSVEAQRQRRRSKE
jgi:hypothetical protein